MSLLAVCCLSSGRLLVSHIEPGLRINDGHCTLDLQLLVGHECHVAPHIFGFRYRLGTFTFFLLRLTIVLIVLFAAGRATPHQVVLVHGTLFVHGTQGSTGRRRVAHLSLDPVTALRGVIL